MLVRPRRYTIKPRTRHVNYGSPLASGMSGCWVFNEGAGPQTVSLINPNDILSFMETTNTKWLTNQVGTVVDCNSNLAGLKLTTPSARLTPAGACTLFVRYQVNGAGTVASNPFIAGVTYTSSASSPYYAFALLRKTGGTDIYFCDDAAGAGNAPFVTNLLATGNIYTTAITFRNGGNCVGYHNGRQVISNARTGSLTYVTPWIWLNNDWTNENSQLSYDVFYMWDRELSAAEILQLHYDPYAPISQIHNAHIEKFGSSSPLSVLVSDSISLSDAMGLQVNILVSLSDSISLSDNLGSINNSIPIAKSDFINFVDSIQRFSAFFMSFGDAVSLSDAIIILLQSATLNLTVSVSDTITLTDTIALILTSLIQSVSVSDVLTLTDNVTLSVNAFNMISVADTLNFQDSVEVLLLESFNSYIRRYLNDVI